MMISTPYLYLISLLLLLEGIGCFVAAALILERVKR